MLIALTLGILYLCWGSFLNVVGHRLIYPSDSRRSQCPTCHHTLAWYDLIPLLSFTLSRGVCRYCHHPISWLYPFIECVSLVSFMALSYMVEAHYFIGGFILFSALVISIRTDISDMLISRWVTLCLIPIGFLCSFFDFIPIYPLTSILGASIGYLILWVIGSSYYWLTNKEGIGQGDYDLIGFIGSFLGLVGIWSTLLIGSVLGCIIFIPYLWSQGNLQRTYLLPFGPFLAIGAIISFLFYTHIALYLGVYN